MIKRRKERLVSNKGAGLAMQARALDAMINGAATGAKEGMNFTEKQVIDNGTTLLLAGHETTANLLTWTVYLLAVHREWQERARVEAKGLETLDFKQVSQLKTISMILWESLRLFPPQPVIGRVCVRENVAGGLLIPEKMETITSLLALHCNPDVWGDDAEEFKPKRFANGINKACKNSSAFLPFGLGPRTCIGQSLALLEARVILYFMLKTYSWELSPAYRHAPDVTLTLQPGFGMPIVLTRER
jgi:cytochrome P450